MRLAERLLRLACRAPDAGDYPGEGISERDGAELAQLRMDVPNLSALVRHRRVVDFGCGLGRQAIALAREEQAIMCGVDTNPSMIARAKAHVEQAGLPHTLVRFVDALSPDERGTFDVVISQNSMEHFPEPERTLREMVSLLRPGGWLVVTFGLPWYAPYGAHMHFFCRVPWVHLIFSERTVMTVRASYRRDGARRYVDVESGLNQMSVRRFERLIRQSGVLLRSMRYTGVKGLDWLTRVPLVRELATNHVTCLAQTPTR